MKFNKFYKFDNGIVVDLCSVSAVSHIKTSFWDGSLFTVTLKSGKVITFQSKDVTTAVDVHDAFVEALLKLGEM